VTSYGYQSGKGTWDYGAAAMNPPVDSRARFANTLNLGEAMVSDIQLLSHDPLPAPEKDGAELLIAVTDIDLKSGESERIRKSSGDVVWIPSGRKSTPLNAAADPARMVLIQFKTVAGK
jgi:hypothetical protein